MTSPFDILLEPAEKKSVHEASVKLGERSGRYTLGAPKRPTIVHDNGFLDRFPKREPDYSDRLKLAQWISMLEGSEALCSKPTAEYIPLCHGEDLSDANAAYRHFLFGDGKDRTIDYERFLQGDPRGSELLSKLVIDFQTHVEIIGKDRMKFSVTSDIYTVGEDGFVEYPSTVNWQRTLGGHVVWVSGDITVSANREGEIIYSADMVIHMEDRYNFNPGQRDLSTGIPDSANGIFEVTGLAHQYTNYGTVHKSLKWVEGNRGESPTALASKSRLRKPQDNRRLRNKI